MNGAVETHHFASGPSNVDVREYIHNNADGIQQLLANAVQRHTAIKVYAAMDVQFYRTTVNGELQQTTARFRTSPDVLSDTANINIDGIAGEFMSSIENFSKRGSNWIVDFVVDFLITLAPYRPMQGSTFIPTPKKILHKKAIVNVQNRTDNLCFLWSILAGIYPVDHNPNRLYHYTPHLHKLNTTGLSFPMSVRDVPKFENLNPNISVSVTVFEERQLIPLYLSPHRNRQHTLHLLLLSDGNTQHFTLIRNLSRLVGGRTNHQHQTYVCPYCFHCFAQEHCLNNHIPNCSTHKPQVITFPEEEDAVLSYKATQKEFTVPYVIYVDFESFLTPSADKNSVNVHVPSWFCCLKVSKFDGEIFEPYVYSGENVMSKFYEYTYAEQQKICEKLDIQKDMIPLTEQEKSITKMPRPVQIVRKISTKIREKRWDITVTPRVTFSVQFAANAICSWNTERESDLTRTKTNFSFP